MLSVSARVATFWGDFRAQPSSLPDGPVVMTIRPEQLRLRADGVGNCLPGRVLRRRDAGAYTRLTIQVPNGAAPLLLESRAVGPLSATRPGERVAIHLPPEHLWLLPAEEHPSNPGGGSPSTAAAQS